MSIPMIAMIILINRAHLLTLEHEGMMRSVIREEVLIVVEQHEDPIESQITTILDPQIGVLKVEKTKKSTNTSKTRRSPSPSPSTSNSHLKISSLSSYSAVYRYLGRFICGNCACTGLNLVIVNCARRFII
jgi:hypothetical protein